MPEGTSILIIAGEQSGDRHGARLVHELRAMRPELTFFGVAGPRLRDVGVDAVVDADDLAIIGVAEIARSLPMFIRAMREIKREALSRRPAAAILVDFPEFNLKLVRWLNRHGIRVVYYISPQLWAWRKYRVSAIRKYVDLMITILPFEKAWYAKHGVHHVEFAGHPLSNAVAPERSREEFCQAHEFEAGRPLVTLLPGSRRTEIRMILGPLLEAAASIREQRPDVQFVIPLADERYSRDVVECLDKSPIRPTLVFNETYDALAASDAAAVTSGTATLEAGLIGTPMVIVYRTSAVNYALLKPLIDVPYYGLVNLIAGEQVAKELIQDDLTAQNVADEVLRLLEPAVNKSVRQQLAEACGKLDQGGGPERAAALILNLLERSDL